MKLLLCFLFIFSFTGKTEEMSTTSKRIMMLLSQLDTIISLTEEEKENKKYFEEFFLPCYNAFADCLTFVSPQIKDLGYSIVSVQEYILKHSDITKKENYRNANLLSSIKRPTSSTQEQKTELKVLTYLLKKGLKDCRNHNIGNLLLSPLLDFIHSNKDVEVLVFGENHVKNYFDTEIILNLAQSFLNKNKKIKFHLENIGHHNQKHVDEYIAGKSTWAQFLSEIKMEVELGEKEKALMDFAKKNTFNVIALDNKINYDDKFEEQYGRIEWMHQRDLFMTSKLESNINKNDVDVHFVIVGAAHLKGQKNIHDHNKKMNILYFVPVFISDSNDSKTIQFHERIYLYTVPVIDKYELQYGNQHILKIND